MVEKEGQKLKGGQPKQLAVLGLRVRGRVCARVGTLNSGLTEVRDFDNHRYDSGGEGVYYQLNLPSLVLQVQALVASISNK